MVVSKDVSDMKQALKAYENSMKCEVNSFASVPDLHFNIATVQRFLQNYGDAITSLEKAVQLADAKVEVDARLTLEALMNEITLLDKLTRSKCGLKSKTS
eukprot:UN19658